MEFFKLVLIASGISSIMVIMIFLVKLLFKDKLGVKWNYYIWFLLLLRLIIPPNFIESSLSIFNVVPAEIRNEISLTDTYDRANDFFYDKTNNFSHHGRYNEAQSSQKGDKDKIENIASDINYTIHPTKNKVKIMPNPITMIKNNKDSIFKLAYILWGIGVIILTIYTIYANIKLYLKINKNRISNYKRLDQILSSCKEKMNINKRVTLIIENDMKVAAIFGLLSPKLLLPGQIINKLSDNEVKHIILHELSHLKRKDIATKWIMTAMQIIHWFNPIIWYSFYRMNQDCEVACDATALSYIETKDHKEYGFTIIRLVELFSQPNWIPGSMSVVGNKSNIKRRINMINLFRKNSWKWSIIGIISFAIIGAIGLTSSKQTVQATEVSQQMAKSTDSKTITFTDPNLEKAIRKKIDEPSGDITKEDVEEITVLDLIESDICNLQGIQYLTNLTSLDLSYNEIKDISPLENLTNLTSLVLNGKGSDSEIEDISPLKNLTNLTSLELEGNEIEDISPLENLTNLTSLELGYNKIKDISLLKNLTNLTSLTLQNNEIKDISSLKNLTNLTNLSLSVNKIEDISPLKNLTNLTNLWVRSNGIKDISPLKNLTNLTGLMLESNEIEDISSLENLTNLTNLTVKSNGIEDISPLENLTNLTGLTLMSNRIKDISPLENLTSLTGLALEGNEIEDISLLKNLTSLTGLTLMGNGIEDISPLGNLTNLTSLDLDGNGITDYSPLGNLTNLTSLDLGDSEIKDISSLENVTSLTYLSLGNNEIEDISPLENLTNLTNLHLRSNRIKDINPLENLTNLTSLDLSDNEIKDIRPLENLTNLTYLELGNNKIENISPLENLTNLTYLELRDAEKNDHKELDSNEIIDYSPIENLKNCTIHK